MQEGEMITLAQAERETGVPVRIMRLYIKAGKMWAERRMDALGRPYWVTVLMEAQRAKKLYRPHSRPKD